MENIPFKYNWLEQIVQYVVNPNLCICPYLGRHIGLFLDGHLAMAEEVLAPLFLQTGGKFDLMREN